MTSSHLLPLLAWNSSVGEGTNACQVRFFFALRRVRRALACSAAALWSRFLSIAK